MKDHADEPKVNVVADPQELQLRAKRRAFLDQQLCLGLSAKFRFTSRRGSDVVESTRPAGSLVAAKANADAAPATQPKVVAPAESSPNADFTATTSAHTVDNDNNNNNNNSRRRDPQQPLNVAKLIARFRTAPPRPPPSTHHRKDRKDQASLQPQDCASTAPCSAASAGSATVLSSPPRDKCTSPSPVGPVLLEPTAVLQNSSSGEGHSVPPESLLVDLQESLLTTGAQLDLKPPSERAPDADASSQGTDTVVRPSTPATPTSVSPVLAQEQPPIPGLSDVVNVNTQQQVSAVDALVPPDTKQVDLATEASPQSPSPQRHENTRSPLSVPVPQATFNPDSNCPAAKDSSADFSTAVATDAAQLEVGGGRRRTERARVVAFWDIENVHIPRGASAFRVVAALRRHVGALLSDEAEAGRLPRAWGVNLQPIDLNKDFFFNFHVAFRLAAFHSPSKGTLSNTLRRELSTAGVSLIDVGKVREGHKVAMLLPTVCVCVCVCVC
jgi:hypothetical protein